MKRTLLLMLLSLSLHAQYHEASEAGYDFDAAQRYCGSLEGEWRIPHIKELFTLMGDEEFTPGRSFWSADFTHDGISRGDTGSEGEARRPGGELGYSFYLQEGDITLSPITKKAGVICTDSPVKTPNTHYVQTPNGIEDKSNALLWQPLDATDKKAKRSFEEAQEFCESLELFDRSWRLPTLDELYSIVSYVRNRPTVDTKLFGVMMSRYYWSDDEFNDDEAYVVGFKFGSVATSAKTNSSYLRCVSELDE